MIDLQATLLNWGAPPWVYNALIFALFWLLLAAVAWATLWCLEDERKDPQRKERSK